MVGPRKLLEAAIKGAAEATGAKILLWFLSFAAAGVVVLKAMHITWWSVLLFLGLLVPPYAFSFIRFAAKQRRGMPAPKQDPSVSSLIIHRATWSAEADPTRFADVTEKLREVAQANFVDTSVEIGVLGDPAPGKGKALRVLYSVVREKVVPESPRPERLVLPEQGISDVRMPELTPRMPLLIEVNGISWSLDDIDRPVGLAAVRESEQGGPNGKTLIPGRPRWDLVRQLRVIPIWEAVAISLDIDSESLQGYKEPTRRMLHERERARMDHRCLIAEDAIPERLPAQAIMMADGRKFQSTVEFSRFLLWATLIGWKLPSELRPRA